MKILSKLNFVFTLILLFVNAQLFAQISGSSTVCAGQTESYTSSNSASNYQWSVTGASSYTASGSSVTISWGAGGTGNVSLSTFNQNNTPTGSYSLTVGIGSKPNAAFQSSFSSSCSVNDEGFNDSCLLACQFQPVIYSAPVTAGVSYTWEIIGNGTMTTVSSNSIEVVWQTLGIQYIKLTASTGAGCSNQIEQCVRVLESPTAIIGTSQGNLTSLTVCKNAPMFLSDLSTNSIGRRWDFGDGNSSDKLNPTHSFSTAGTYQIVLTANNACFCLNSDTLTVVVNDTEGAEIICPSVVCDGDTFSYSTPSSCGNFRWSATNGTIIGSDTGTTVDVVWSNHPAYIELDATNCNNVCNAPSVEKISVVTDSIPIQGANPVCFKDVNTYSISPIEGSTYTWIVDPSLGLKKEDKGYYITVEITGQGGGGYIGVTYNNALLGCSGYSEIYVSAKPRMNFAMPSEVCQNDTDMFMIDFPVDWTITDSLGTVVFTDLNTTETTIDWSSIASGNYTLTLGKLNSYCNDIVAPITILAAPLAPDTIYGLNNICIDDAYIYSADPRTGYVIEWVVTGGTPEVAIGNTVSVDWSGIAPYSIKAAYRQLASPNCLSNFTTKVLASSTNGIPTILGQDSICGGDTASLSLSFVADDVEWFVIPDDGASILTSRFGNSVNVQFSAATTQTVTLRAIGTVCNNPFTLDHTVIVETFDAPIISFSNSNPCPDVPVQFFTNSRSPITWKINGQPYNVQRPIVSFDSAQTVIVKATSTNVGAMGCIVERVNIAQLVVKAAPKASISVLDTNLNHCPDTLYPIFMAAALQGVNSSAYSHQWYKDGNPIAGFANTYTTPAVLPHGSYTVEITAPNGCVSTSKPIEIDTCSSSGGCRNISADSTITVEVVLDSSSCSDFYVQNVIVGGGATLVDIRLTSTNLVSTDVGTYDIGVNLKAGVHSMHFEGSVEKGGKAYCFLLIVNKTVQVEPDFKIIKQPCSPSGTPIYTLLNTSTYSGLQPTSTWTYTGGTLVTGGYSPSVQYPAGTFSVTLTYSGGCSITKQVTVDPISTAFFSSSAPSCQQEPVNFTNVSSGNILEYNWDFDGQVLFKEHPAVTFSDPQNYTTNFTKSVTLNILDADGCRKSYSQLISIRGNKFNGLLTPTNPPAICEGNTVQLSYNQSLVNPNTPITYQWSNLESTPTIQASQTGNYKLTLTDNAGCKFVTNQANVQVNTATNPTIIGKQTFCSDDTVRLSILNHPSYNVSWRVTPSGLTQNGTYNFKKKLSTGSHTINTNISNNITGCPSSNPPFPVTVLSAIPKPSITASNSYPLCEGSPIQLNASPAGSNFYWNTGQTGNSITQSLGGRYTVFQTDISGCKSSQYIDINPKPDFSNFMTGCYCIPTGNTPNILGIPNMASYQWIKDGQNVPLPSGGLQDLPASTGSFDLIAVTDSGCVDTAGTIDITMGGCEDCMLSLSDFQFNCVQTIGDSVFYNFILQADLDQANAFYNLNHTMTINGLPATILQVQPNSISGTRNTVTGSFVAINTAIGDSVCIQLTASNPAVNCTATICTAIESVACDFVPIFNYSFNPYSCQLNLIQNAILGSCITPTAVDYIWTVTQGRTTFASSGDQFLVDGLVEGSAQVCLEMEVYNAADSSVCIKDTCFTIEVPDCNCYNNCQNISLASATFVQFIQNPDSCIQEFKVVLNNPQNVLVYANYIKTNSGKILSITPTQGGFNQVAYLVRFYSPKDECLNQCFDLYLNNSGTDCCIQFCVDLPKCSCDIRLSDLGISCSGAGSTNGYHDFKFFADIGGCSGFTYDVSELTATLNGSSATIVKFNPSTIVAGKQLISGTVDLSGLTGNPLCFDLTASLGGITCSESICMDLPKTPCDLRPSFDTNFDASKCVLTLTNTTITNPCVKIDSSKLKWEVTHGGVTYVQYGNEVQFFNASGTDITICLTVESSDFAGINFCTEKICETISITDCVCEEPCENIVVSTTVFDKILPSKDSCIFRFQVTVEDLNGNPFNLNSIIAHNGTVLATKLLQSSGGKNTYEVDFYPNDPWTGGNACFNVFVTTDEGEICCTDFCILLPKCECDFYIDLPVIDCTGPNGTMGDFTFSIPTGLDGTVGFNYNYTITATLNGTPVSINSYAPATLIHGLQNVTGLISLPQGNPGDLLCFTITADMGGRSCFSTVCVRLPANNCDIVPDFTWSLDPDNCELIFTNTSMIGSCTYVDPANVKWSFYPQNGGLSYATGNVVNYGQFSGNMRVCLNVLGLNWTGDLDCHPTVCKDIFVPRCPEEPNDDDYEDEEEKKGDFRFERKSSNTPTPMESLITYPNPVQSILNIEWSKSIDGEVLLILKDQQSKVVLNDIKTVSGSKTSVDINNLSDGIYILEVQWDNEITRKKIVILK